MFSKKDIMKISNKPTIISLTGGLGNQLFQLAAGLYLTKTNPLLLEWRLGKPRLNHFGLPEISSFTLPSEVKFLGTSQENFFASKAFGYVLRQGISPRTYERFVGVRFVSKLLASLVISINLRRLTLAQVSGGVGFSTLSRSDSGKLLIGYFQTHRYLDDPEVLQYMRKIQINEVTSRIKFFSELADIENPLIVHIRLGDYKNEKLFGIPSPEFYSSAIKQLLSTGHYSKVWVFSDEPDLARKLFTTAIPSDARWIHSKSDSAAQTLEIMRHGRGYVIANSTFSWWAATLSYTLNPAVIAPEPWFKFLDSPKDLIPSNWYLSPGWID
jgi:hypothetical protein